MQDLIKSTKNNARSGRRLGHRVRSARCARAQGRAGRVADFPRDCGLGEGSLPPADPPTFAF